MYEAAREVHQCLAFTKLPFPQGLSEPLIFDTLVGEYCIGRSNPDASDERTVEDRG